MVWGQVASSLFASNQFCSVAPHPFCSMKQRVGITIFYRQKVDPFHADKGLCLTNGVGSTLDSWRAEGVSRPSRGMPPNLARLGGLTLSARQRSQSARSYGGYAPDRPDSVG